MSFSEHDLNSQRCQTVLGYGKRLAISTKAPQPLLKLRRSATALLFNARIFPNVLDRGGINTDRPCRARRSHRL
jgi:hypothetical protein